MKNLNKNQIKLLIEKQKCDKETLQFEINNLLIYLITLVIGIATISVSVIISLNIV